MRFSNQNPLLFLAVALFGVLSHASDIRLSGTVTDLSGKPLSGVGVTLVGTGDATSTNVTGVWSIPIATSGIVAASKSKVPSIIGHLVVQEDRIRLRFDGADAVGRRFSGMEREGASKNVATLSAARSAATFVDTLLFSWNGRVRARVGIPSLTAGDLGAQSINTAMTTTAIPWNSSVTYGSLTDTRDGQSYRTVTIGAQTWMAENLNYRVDNSWCYYNRADSCAKYGRLYRWTAAMGLDSSYTGKLWSGTSPQQGVCPSDWHVPSEAEWDTLATSVGGKNIAGGILGSTGSDTYGFRALLAGYRYGGGQFTDAGSDAYFWSSEGGAGIAGTLILGPGYNALSGSYHSKKDGCSLRCLKDSP